MSLTGKRIILGVTGGIAAYKAAVLLRELQKSGAEVRCTATPFALRFIGADTLSSLTRQPVPSEVFPDDGDVSENWSRHVQWAEWADLMIVAPCTANTLAKIAHGISDNMLTTTLLAVHCPVLICPTMDGGMYEAPAVRRNRTLVAEAGYTILEPEHGYLASGLHDVGRLPETSAILEAAKALITPQNQPLKGKKVVVTAGPTREYLDPVRFLSNPSSGKMGYAMAEAAVALGADVTLISGPVALQPPAGVKTENFSSTDDLFKSVQKHADADVIIMAAAVSDFKPKNTHAQKVKKEGAALSVELERTPDILTWLGERKQQGQVLIGFAMETENLIEQARKKRESKNADFILANSISESGSGFESDTNKLYIIGKNAGSDPEFVEGTKKEISRRILLKLFP